MRGTEAILIAGPTASGKSRLALDLAAEHRGTIINADSMQVYAELRILTARPAEADLEAVPHRLYGHVPPEQAYSVGDWVREVEPLLQKVRAEGRIPVICGGTGLYFKALLGGLSAMPSVDAGLREAWRSRMAAEGPAALHALLSRHDPETAAGLRPTDPQRILRALEILDATGRPLVSLQAVEGSPLVDPRSCLKIVLTPDRAVLRERIAQRFAVMLKEGALDEVRAFRRRSLPPDAPARKAIGLPELAAHLDGTLSLAEACQRAVTRSRQYAKRQETWFRHQFDASWVRLASPAAEALENLDLLNSGARPAGL